MKRIAKIALPLVGAGCVIILIALSYQGNEGSNAQQNFCAPPLSENDRPLDKNPAATSNEDLATQNQSALVGSVKHPTFHTTDKKGVPYFIEAKEAQMQGDKIFLVYPSLTQSPSSQPHSLQSPSSQSSSSAHSHDEKSFQGGTSQAHHALDAPVQDAQKRDVSSQNDAFHVPKGSPNERGDVNFERAAGGTFAPKQKEHTMLSVRADQGIFHQGEKTLTLQGNVVLHYGAGVRMNTEHVELFLDDESAKGRMPLKGRLKSEARDVVIEAGAFEVHDKGHRVVFSKQPKLTFYLGDDNA